MGYDILPLYGELDLGSAIETAETVIGKIKTNKYDVEDLADLKKSLTAIVKACEKDED